MMMRVVLAIVLCCLSHGIRADQNCAVTYDVPGGRFGDQLIVYMHAKWIAYRYDIPLLYKPFSYSSELVLDEKEKLYRGPAAFEHLLQVDNPGILEENLLSNTLFVAPESSYELKLQKWPYFPVDWQDPEFLSLLRSLICLKSPIPLEELPTGYITIAVHVRRGGGFDDPAQFRHWPLKFPPDAFYIAQIRKIYEMTQQQLFIHIFTDDPDPELIAHTYAEALTDIDVLFDYRSQGNSYKSHVLADLFDMMRYQCLIRPESNYSIAAEKLGDFDIVIHPVQCIIKDKQIVITETNTLFKKGTSLFSQE
jgi:hypothetical protein